MTDERDKPSRNETSARVTARDVPFTRDAGSEAEPVPRARRPQQLPRDPTYEAELAQVELAVLRNPERRDDPSTKQGGRRTPRMPSAQPPESVTPESPVTRSVTEPSPSHLAFGAGPPSSGGRASAGGTLLSIGGVDPRAKTERTLETPRMYFSNPSAGGEVYFKPGKIPAVTVHQTQEMETVKLADSIDPRRAKTIPRIDRQALQRYVESEGFAPESAAPMVLNGPGSNANESALSSGPSFAADDYEPASSLGEALEGQIHASLSPFREHAEPSYGGFDGVPTRAEPLAARRGSDAPPSVPAPDPSAVPTHRDLPQHRVEASLPPPPPMPSLESLSQSAPTLVRVPAPSGFGSEAPAGTSASIAAKEERRRPAWVNLAAFGVALLLTIIVGLWLTRGSEQSPAASDSLAPARPARTEPQAHTAERSEPAPVSPAPPPPAATAGVAPTPAATNKPAKASATAVPPPADTSSSSRKTSTPKSSRETIF